MLITKGFVLTMKLSKKQRELASEQAEANEIKEFNKAIQFGEKSLLLFATFGAIYQLINGKNTFYFKRVGGEMKGIYPENLVTDFFDESRFSTDKKDFTILKSDITEISINQKHSANCPFAQSGKIVIRCNSKKWRFVIMNEINIEQIKRFFNCAVSAEIKMPAKLKEQREEVVNDSDAEKLPMLKNVNKLLSFVSWAAAAIFWFALSWLPSFSYTIMSVICIKIPIIALILYFKYNGVVSISDTNRGKNYYQNRVSVLTPLLIPTLTLMLRAILDFNIVDYKMLIILSITFAAVIIIAFFVFSKEYKVRKSAIAVIVIFALIYAGSLCLHINNLKYENPTYISANVYDKYVDEGSKSPTTYHLNVTLSNGKKMDLQVTKQDYDNISKGATVNVAERIGLLGITIADVVD